MQDDDTSNPGDALGARRRGAVGAQGGRARTSPARTATAMPRARCAACRRAIRRSARRAAAPVDIEQRINLCRTGQQKAPPFAYESRDLLALTAYRRAAVARDADRGCGRREDQAVHRGGPQALRDAPGPAQSLLPELPRRQLGPEARRRAAGAGPSERLPALPARMAERRLAAAPAAQLPDRHAGGALCLRRGGICRRWSCS